MMNKNELNVKNNFNDQDIDLYYHQLPSFDPFGVMTPSVIYHNNHLFAVGGYSKDYIYCLAGNMLMIIAGCNKEDVLTKTVECYQFENNEYIINDKCMNFFVSYYISLFFALFFFAMFFCVQKSSPFFFII